MSYKGKPEEFMDKHPDHEGVILRDNEEESEGHMMMRKKAEPALTS